MSNTEEKTEVIAISEAHFMLNVLGRPPKFDDPKQMLEQGLKYLEACANENTVPTIAGMAFCIGMDRQSFFNYSKKSDYFYVIKALRDYILIRLEKRLMNMNTPQAGVIFLAKNYGYSDKQEVEFTKPLEILVRDYTGSKVLTDPAIQEAEIVEDQPTLQPSQPASLPPEQRDNKTDEDRNSENEAKTQ